jgi:hypothetical protein
MMRPYLYNHTAWTRPAEAVQNVAAYINLGSTESSRRDRPTRRDLRLESCFIHVHVPDDIGSLFKRVKRLSALHFISAL